MHMRKIQMHYFLRLLSPAENVYDLERHYYRGKQTSPKSTMSIKDFFTHLPVQKETLLPIKDTFNGYSEYYKKELYGCVTTEETQPIDLFRGMKYSYYRQLEEDINRIVPTYEFERKPKQTLTEYLDYFKEALKGVSMEQLSERFGGVSIPISIEMLQEGFHCINETEGIYILPFETAQNYPQLGATQTDEGVAYLLTTIDKEMIVYMKKETFYAVKIKNGKIEVASFPRTDVENLALHVDEYFPEEKENSRYYGNVYSANTIVIKRLEEENTSLIVKTTAKLIAKGLNYEKHLPALRECFAQLYNVKGRSEDELWTRVYPHMEKTLPNIQHPLFEGMDKGDGEVEVDETVYPDIIQALNGTEVQRLDMTIKLHLLLSRSIIDGTANMATNTTMLHTSSGIQELFCMPDYGECAVSAPDIHELLK